MAACSTGLESARWLSETVPVQRLDPKCPAAIQVVSHMQHAQVSLVRHGGASADIKCAVEQSLAGINLPVRKGITLEGHEQGEMKWMTKTLESIRSIYKYKVVISVKKRRQRKAP
jgi:hypothetical protein